MVYVIIAVRTVVMPIACIIFRIDDRNIVFNSKLVDAFVFPPK